MHLMLDETSVQHGLGIITHCSRETILGEGLSNLQESSADDSSLNPFWVKSSTHLLIKETIFLNALRVWTN